MSARGSYDIANVRVDAGLGEDAVHQIAVWCRQRTGGSRTVCFVNAFSIVMASRDESFHEVLNKADLCVADGAPVAWVGRSLTGHTCERLSGPDLMHRLLADPGYGDIKHFVYGGDQSSLDRLEFRYNRGGTRDPRVIVGTYSPPYRELTSEEEVALVSRVQSLRPDIVWVCLGTGRQEEWMARMRERLSVPVLAGVGAAVDFLSGNKPRAPRWMQRLGVEWAFRLATEPRRLWRRYLIGNLLFIRLAGVEIWRQARRGGKA